MTEHEANAPNAILGTIWTRLGDGTWGVAPGDDAELLNHGTMWVLGLIAVHAITPESGLPPAQYEEIKGPHRQAVWEAERAIDALPARTARGAALKLRMTLYTMLPEGMVEPFLRNDLETITAGDVDYPARAVAKILQDLDAMAEAKPTPDASQGEARP